MLILYNYIFLISFFLLNIISVLCTGSNIYLVSFKDYQLRIMQFARLLQNKCDFFEESQVLRGKLRLYNRKLGTACISMLSLETVP